MGRKDRHLRQHVPASGAALYLRLLMTLGSALGLVTTVVVMLIRLANPFAYEADPFSPWFELPQTMPANLEAYCVHTFEVTRELESCYLFPHDEQIAQVIVGISYRRVLQMRIIPRSQTLTLGDLIALWGYPEMQRFGGLAQFRWSLRSTVVTGDYVQWPPSYHTFIESITVQRVGNGSWLFCSADCGVQ